MVLTKTVQISFIARKLNFRKLPFSAIVRQSPKRCKCIMSEENSPVTRPIASMFSGLAKQTRPSLCFEMQELQI
jgi:hypothetical protein